MSQVRIPHEAKAEFLRALDVIMEFVNQDTATAEMVQIALDAINDMNSTLRGACLGESRLLDIIAPILEKIADCRQTIVEKLAMIQQLTTA